MHLQSLDNVLFFSYYSFNSSKKGDNMVIFMEMLLAIYICGKMFINN